MKNATERSVISLDEVMISGICRVCLQFNSEEHVNKIVKQDNLISIFGKYKNSLISDNINDIVSFNIKEDDGLPDKICLSCVQALDAAYEFKQKCERSNNMLRSAIDAGVPFHMGLIKDLIKQEPLNSEHDEEPVHSGELQEEDIKHEYEYTELTDGDTQGDDFQPSEQLTAHTDSKFKSKAIDLHLECHDCGQFFKSKCKLRVHWKREHLRSQLICPNCKKSFGSYKSLHLHFKQKPKSCVYSSKINIEGVGKSRVYYCRDCEFKTVIMQSMYQHLELHSEVRSYSCELCGKAFSQFSGLFTHRQIFHKIGEKEVTCQTCGKHLVGVGSIYRHMKQHIDRSVVCDVCNKKYKNKAILRIHMRLHSKVKSFECDFCSKTFHAAINLKYHRENVHIKSRLYNCNKCEFADSSYKRVRTHKSKHTATNIPCIECGLFFDNEQQLAVHKERHNKDCECPHCHKLFYRQKNLNSHLRKQHNIKQSTIKNKALAKTNQ